MSNNTDRATNLIKAVLSAPDEIERHRQRLLVPLSHEALPVSLSHGPKAVM